MTKLQEIKDRLKADETGNCPSCGFEWDHHAHCPLYKTGQSKNDDIATLIEAVELLKKCAEDCRTASKINEPRVDKWIIRNMTGQALNKLDQLLGGEE